MLTRTEVIETYAFMVWCLLVSANICDAKSYRIPNELIGLGYLLGLYIQITTYGFHGFMIFSARAILPILLLYLLFLIDGLGAGDIKLFSVCAATVVGTASDMVKLFVISIYVAAAVIFFRNIRERRFNKEKLHFSYYITTAFFVIQWL